LWYSLAVFVGGSLICHGFGDAPALPVGEVGFVTGTASAVGGLVVGATIGALDGRVRAGWALTAALRLTLVVACEMLTGADSAWGGLFTLLLEVTEPHAAWALGIFSELVVDIYFTRLVANPESSIPKLLYRDLSKQCPKYRSIGAAFSPLTGNQPSRCLGEFEARVLGFDIRADILA
jgi:hypothetical protein